MGKKKEQLPAEGKKLLKAMEKGAGKGKGKLPAWLKRKEGPGDLTIGGVWGMLGPDGTQCLVKPLEKAQCTNLNLSVNNLGDEGMKFLCNALRVNERISTINLSSNCIGDGGGLAFGAMLMRNRTLENINLCGNQMTDKTLQAIALALRTRADPNQESGQGTVVDMSWNWVGHRGCMEYQKALSKCYHGTFPIGQSFARFQVHLGGQCNPTKDKTDDRVSGIGDEGCKSICHGVKDYGIKGVHESMHLWHNDIGRDGAKAIAEMMAQNDKVTDLNLSYNSLGGMGVESIAKEMLQASPLRVLNLSNNIITSRGGVAIADLIKRGHKPLTQINLSHNELDDTAAKAIAEALEGNNTMKKLDLSFNDKIGKEGARAFGPPLEKNTHMMILSFLKMKWDDDTQDMVGEFAKKSPYTLFRTEDSLPDDKDGKVPRPQPIKVYCRTLVDQKISDILIGGQSPTHGHRGSVGADSVGGRRKSSARGQRKSMG